MSNAANHAERQQLRDGNYIEVRALMPEDEAGMLAAIERTGIQSLQRRFFVTKRGVVLVTQDMLRAPKK